MKFLKCHVCDSKDVRKRGFRYNDENKKQKYQCFDCKKWFVEDDGFKRMRFKKEIVIRAIHMHIDGFSLFKVQYHLWQHDGIKVTKRAISQWIKKYSLFLKSGKYYLKAKNKRRHPL